MRLSDLNNEIAESIRVHHASAHFTTDEAAKRLLALGMGEARVAAVLAEPVDEALFVKYKTSPKGETR